MSPTLLLKSCPKTLAVALLIACVSSANAQNTPPAATTPAPAPASLTAPAPVVQATGSAIRQDNGDFYTQIYRVPTADEITAVLDRVRNFMETSTPAKLMAGGAEVTDFSQPIPGVTLERGPQFPFQLLTYEQGVVFIGSGKISLGKLSQALDYGALTLQIHGDFDDCLRRVREIAVDVL